MLLMSPNWLFLGPGVICFLASLVCYFLTFSDLLVVGDVRFGPLSMIFFQTGAIFRLGADRLKLFYQYVINGVWPEIQKKLPLSDTHRINSDKTIFVGLFFVLSGLFWAVTPLFIGKNLILGLWKLKTSFG